MIDDYSNHQRGKREEGELESRRAIARRKKHGELQDRRAKAETEDAAPD